VNLSNLQSLRGYGKAVLEVAGLILSIVNGLMLLRFYLRDRARLTVHPIHPDTYQWWFTLPPGEFEGKATRRYGFVTYVAIQNSGLRKTQLTSWRLSIRLRLGRSRELKPINMPEPSAKIGEHVKLYPVLGQRGLHFEGDTLVDSGCSASGMVYYFYECYGGEGWDPKTSGQQIKGTFYVSNGFNGKAKCIVRFRPKSLEEIKTFAPGIDAIGKGQAQPGESGM
jgi:hypothetical protein